MWQIFRELKSSVRTTQRIGETLRQHGSGGAFLGSGVQRQKGTRSASESAATLTRASPPPPAPSTSCFSPRGLKSPAPPAFSFHLPAKRSGSAFPQFCLSDFAFVVLCRTEVSTFDVLFISLYLCMTICAFYGLPKKSCSVPKSKTQLPRFS